MFKVKKILLLLLCLPMIILFSCDSNKEKANKYKLDGLNEFGRPAIDAYSKCIEFNPEDDLCYELRGKEYFSLNYYEFAIKDFTKAIKINPKNWNAYSGRGVARSFLEGSNSAGCDDFATACFEGFECRNYDWHCK